MNNTAHLSLLISAALIALSAFGAEPQSASQSTGLPVTLSLDKPGYVTAVIERADGRRVYNLASEVKAQAGPLTFNWANIANLSSATTTITMQASNQWCYSGLASTINNYGTTAPLRPISLLDFIHQGSESLRSLRRSF